jgi:hypothetical protein
VRSLRATVAIAAVLVLGELTTLIHWGPQSPGPLLSGSIQLLMGLLCLAVTIGAARGGGSLFERRFLWLVVARYVLCASAQALATSYLVNTRYPFTGSLADLLFHIEDLPLGIAFFLDDPGRGDRLQRPRVLDVALIGAFWVTVALYVRYLSSDAPLGVGLVAATDALVAGCFCLRALTSRSSVASAIFGRWTPAILLSTVNDAYSGFYNSDPGQPFDLVWVLESVVWILTAVTFVPWRAERDEVGRRAVDHAVEWLPVLVGCFSLVLALGLGQRRPGLALGVVLVVATASALRLWIRRGRVGVTES